MTTDQVAPWLTPADVAAQTGAQLDTAGQLPASVELARAAAGSWVEARRRDLVDQLAGAFVPTPEVVEGALLLVARLHARKGSPQGLASFAEFGPAGVLRVDPDVERLLGVGPYGRPVIG